MPPSKGIGRPYDEREARKSTARLVVLQGSRRLLGDAASRREQRYSGELQPGRSLVRAGRLPHADAKRMRRLPRAATRTIFASGPASADVLVHHSSNEVARSGTESSLTTTSASSASASRPAKPVGIVERERARDARGRHRLSELRAHGVEDDAKPRIALARSPKPRPRNARRVAGPAGSRARRGPARRRT